MNRIVFTGLLVTAVFLAGCRESKPTVFENRHDHDHVHERGKLMIEDVGPYHAGLTAHMSKKEGNELDVVFETQDKNDPKPVPLPFEKLTAKVTREEDHKTYVLEFVPAPKEERKDDPDGKCSHFTAKALWMKHEDKLTVKLVVNIDGQDKPVVWVDFNPKKFAHVDE